jgi:hypothetical protein
MYIDCHICTITIFSSLYSSAIQGAICEFTTCLASHIINAMCDYLNFLLRDYFVFCFTLVPYGKKSAYVPAH